jgi:tetratricopeptide (TPR) repeat protein
LAIEPNDRDLNKLLADFYFNLGNYKKALSLLKKIIEIDPQDHKAIWQI